MLTVNSAIIAEMNICIVSNVMDFIQELLSVGEV